jgi:NAD(P)-dependent dehydrogenase (short-subunit alcohol dehydrogenase family)
VARELDRLGIVISNAGIVLPGPQLQSPAAGWNPLMALAVQGQPHVTQAALPYLGHGRGSQQGGPWWPIMGPADVCATSRRILT